MKYCYEQVENALESSMELDENEAIMQVYSSFYDNCVQYQQHVSLPLALTIPYNHPPHLVKNVSENSY